MIEAQSLSKSYIDANRQEVWAVRDVSLTVARGEIVTFTGDSGAGKTTLLALLGAIDRPSAGKVLFQGKNLGVCSAAELARTRQTLAHIFQSFALIPQLSALRNVAYPLIPRGITRRERTRRATEWLTRFGLAKLLNQPVRLLSGGEQQRVGAARAFAAQPEVLFADEPTSSLDEGSAQLLIAAFRELRDAGKTVVLSSHDPRLVALADRVFTLATGQLKA
jgi:putative ABC transport system ATP-binding protein